MDELIKTKQMAAFLEEKLADDIVVLGLGGVSLMADTFILATGRNARQNRALADYLTEEFSRKDIRPLRVEGYREGGWILVDYGDVVVHLFTEEQRRFYNLEKLWADARLIAWQEIEEPKDRTQDGPEQNS